MLSLTLPSSLPPPQLQPAPKEMVDAEEGFPLFGFQAFNGEMQHPVSALPRDFLQGGERHIAVAAVGATLAFANADHFISNAADDDKLSERRNLIVTYLV